MMDRRFFLKSAAATGGLFIGAPFLAHAAEGSVATGQIGHYVRISPDNQVTIGTATVEIGQGTNTSIPMLIVEELDVDFASIRVENIATPWKVGDTGRPESTAFADGAGGSMAVWESYDAARQVGAAARQVLLAAAAKRWGVPVGEVSTDKGLVWHKASKRKLTYGAVADAAAKEPLPTSALQLKPRSAQTLIGTPQKQKDARAIVTGQPLFGIDQQMPGMLHAVIARCPMIDGSVRTLDDRAALAVPGVKAVVRLPRVPLTEAYGQRNLGEGVGVVAESHWAAMKGRDALKIVWDRGPALETSEDAYAAAWDVLANGRTQRVRDTGNVDAAFDKAAKVIEARYELPMVAHATMEPQNTLASVAGGKVRIVTPTQQPFPAMMAAATAAGVDPANVEVVPVRSGGGFGRRLYNDFVTEAVLLSKAAGRPVKLVWTRECDMLHDRYRPGGAHLMRAALDSEGKLTGWLHRAASQSRRYRSSAEGADKFWTSEIFPDDHPGSLVANNRVEWAPIVSLAPRGALRGPGHNINAWVMQAFLDEVAEAAGRDPLAYRLELLGEARELPYNGHGGPVFDTGRMAAVLKHAADKAGWAGPGKGRGIAGHFSFGTYAAHVCDVTMTEAGGFRVDQVTSALDCGIAVNPNGIAMQNEGSINEALSIALGQAITIKDGEVQQRNFDTYQMMRMNRAAKVVATHIVPSDAPPRGIGEPMLPPFTPALTGAIHAATGKRIRKLPIGDQLV